MLGSVWNNQDDSDNESIASESNKYGNFGSQRNFRSYQSSENSFIPSDTAHRSRSSSNSSSRKSQYYEHESDRMTRRFTHSSQRNTNPITRNTKLEDVNWRSNMKQYDHNDDDSDEITEIRKPNHPRYMRGNTRHKNRNMTNRVQQHHDNKYKSYAHIEDNAPDMQRSNRPTHTKGGGRGNRQDQNMRISTGTHSSYGNIGNITSNSRDRLGQRGEVQYCTSERIIPERHVRENEIYTKYQMTQNVTETAQGVKQEGKKQSIGFKKLEALIDKDTNEILFTLCAPNAGLPTLLENIGNNSEFVSLLLIAIAKACKSTHKKNVMSLVGMVTKCKTFMLFSLQSYLVNIRTSNVKPNHTESLYSLLEFFQCFQQLQPASAADTLSIVLPLLKETFKKIFSSDKLESIFKIVDELEVQADSFMDRYTIQERQKVTKNEHMSMAQPPEDYRTIPILPKEQDILEHIAFLRPNIIEGRYPDAEHYLDVQFRLLREDYIRPLREGIATCIQLQKVGMSVKHCKTYKIYPNVHIVKQEMVSSGIIHIVEFDIEDYTHVKWEYTKRFLSGSLMCLSSNNFKNLLFATVLSRDVQKLKNGLLVLRFEDQTYGTVAVNPFENYTMIETDAYFEAYRHNLAALQDMKDANFPLRRYIVDIDCNVMPPTYLNTSISYDMSPILTNVSGIIDVPVLDTDRWPSERDFGLDKSQFEALRSALTKEFVVIQGPPGTGKTYIGLKIVQILLHNSGKWKPSDREVCPILIICYTNHALDQFLEGILKFSKGIVRIGGRSVSEMLETYQLNNLRQSVRDMREVPHHIFSNIRQKNWQLSSSRTTINNLQREMEQCIKTILGEETLRPIINEVHFESLKRVVNRNDVILHDWLELTFNGEYIVPEDGTENNRKAKLCEEMKQDKMQITNKANKVECSNTRTDNNQKLASTEMEYDRTQIAEQGTAANYNNTVAAVVATATVKNQGELEVDDEEELADIDFIEAQRNVETEELAEIQFDCLPKNCNDGIAANEGGWRVQGGQKKRQKYIMKKIQSKNVMSEAEAKRITDVWSLNIEDRWRLYRYWLQKHIVTKQLEISKLQKDMKSEFDELSEMKTEEDMYILQKAEVVGMTTTGAAKYRELVRRLNPRIIIVEEAAEILESHIVTSLAKDTQHLILIGDHQQLRPSPNVYRLAVDFHLEISLFERMVKNGMKCTQLSIQHRMRPNIAELLVPHIYPNLTNAESVMEFEDIKGMQKNVFFVNHNISEGQEYDSKSKVNQHEAQFIVKLCRYLLLQGYSATQITILTTYSGQLFALKKLMKGNDNKMFSGIRVTVVDNFQGEENDIILVSFVRSNVEGNIGFLKISNRVCVALSRAKKGLYCIGNFSLLAEKSDVWKNIMAILQQQEAIGPSLTLCCQNHQNILTEVSKEEDFANAPEGGCTQPCKYRLDCGHVCSSMCHPYDLLHEKVKCLKKCQKPLCEHGHKCPKKCYEDCGPCMVKVEKIISGCNHVVQVPCHVPPNRGSCTEPCSKRLKCGHKCKNKCGEECTEFCNEKVTKSLSCSHSITLHCGYITSANRKISCSVPCQVSLPCGHSCKGTCGTCEDENHLECGHRCEKILPCGHKCRSTCSKKCPPCGRRCENLCSHSKCHLTCGNQCFVCAEPCTWSCRHNTCTQSCGAPCNREPCNRPCPKDLKCHHKCIGFCGEPCPKVCVVCSPQIVRKEFFKTEQNEGARFVLLEDCGHFFEVEGLTHYMKITESTKSIMKTCPQCGKVIRRNRRFGNIVKSILANIETLKREAFQKRSTATFNFNKHVLEFEEEDSDYLNEDFEQYEDEILLSLR